MPVVHDQTAVALDLLDLAVDEWRAATSLQPAAWARVVEAARVAAGAGADVRDIADTIGIAVSQAERMVVRRG